jgi:hypothetical protein
MDKISVIAKEMFDWKDLMAASAGDMACWVINVLIRDEYDCSRLRDRCEVCGHTENLELHHLAGRKHDPCTITVCRSCHDALSNQQKMWDKRWWKDDQPPELRYAFLLMGLRDALHLMARKFDDTNYYTLAEQLTEQIAQRLKED